MWIKIVKGIYVVAKATGLDKKIVNWVKRRIDKQDEKLLDKMEYLDQLSTQFPELDEEEHGEDAKSE